MSETKIVRETLARHREQPSIGLDIKFPINWQMDADLGSILCKDLDGTGNAWEVRRATPSLGDHLPSRCGLYMFVYRSHLDLKLEGGQKHRATWVLYVGRAGSDSSSRTLKDRYKGEYCKYVGGDPENLWSQEPIRGRPDMLKRYLCVWPLEYWFLIVDDRSTIAPLEDRLIKLFAPPLNSYGRLRLRKGEPKPAFRMP